MHSNVNVLNALNCSLQGNYDANVTRCVDSSIVRTIRDRVGRQVERERGRRGVFVKVPCVTALSF